MRKEVEAPPAKLGALAKALVYYEINHLPKRGITSKEIVDKYKLGEVWYEYEGSKRRVNLSGQLVRNELNSYFKKFKIAKLWNRRTGDYVKRDGFIVFVNWGQNPDLQIDAATNLPDRAKWLKDHDR